MAKYRSHLCNIYLDVCTGVYGKAKETGLTYKVRQQDVSRFPLLFQAYSCTSLQLAWDMDLYTWYVRWKDHELSIPLSDKHIELRNQIIARDILLKIQGISPKYKLYE